MKFEYTVPGAGAPAVIDTSSKEFEDRLAWLVRHGLPANPQLKFGVRLSQRSEDGNLTGPAEPMQFGLVEWENPETEFTVETDVYLTYKSPPVALVEVLKAFKWPYPNPAPAFPDPVFPDSNEDWNTPNALIGPPLPGQEGKYQSRGLGNRNGDIWVGPSGQKYQFVMGGFFTYTHWKEID